MLPINGPFPPSQASRGRRQQQRRRMTEGTNNPQQPEGVITVKPLGSPPTRTFHTSDQQQHLYSDAAPPMSQANMSHYLQQPQAQVQLQSLPTRQQQQQMSQAQSTQLSNQYLSQFNVNVNQPTTSLLPSPFQVAPPPVLRHQQAQNISSTPPMQQPPMQQPPMQQPPMQQPPMQQPPMQQPSMQQHPMQQPPMQQPPMQQHPMQQAAMDANVRRSSPLPQVSMSGGSGPDFGGRTFLPGVSTSGGQSTRPTQPHLLSLQQPLRVSSVSNTISTFFGAGAPLRILLPEKWIGLIVGKGGKTIHYISKATRTTIQVVKDHGVPGLRDKFVVIGGASQEDQQRALDELLHQLQTFPKESFADSDGSISVVTLVPEKAVSVLIGSKGATINRISKACNCDIQMQTSLCSLVSSGFSDKMVSVRSDEAANVTMAVTQINMILSDLYFRRKLSASDFIHSLRTPQAIEEIKKLGGSVSHPSGQSKHQTTPSQSTPRRPLLTVDVSKLGSQRQAENDTVFPPAFSRIPHLLRDVIVNTALETSVKFLISQSHAAWIIQRRYQIENTSGALVKVQNYVPPHLLENNKDGRVLILKGNSMAVSSAVHLAIGKFTGHVHPQGNNWSEPIYLVCKKQVVNQIIGPNTHLIETISRDSSAKLRLLRKSNSDINLLSIGGFPDSRVTAVLLILQRIIEGQKRAFAEEQNPVVPSDKETRSTVAQCGTRSKRSRAAMSTSRVRAGEGEGPPGSKRLRPIVEEKTSRHSNSPLQSVAATNVAHKESDRPLEDSFTRVAATLTESKTITSHQQYCICLSFPTKYKKYMQYLGPSWQTNFEQSVTQRCGSKLTIIPSGPVAPADTQGQVSGEVHNVGSTKDDSALIFCISGTAMGNSVAVLLLHEGLTFTEKIYQESINRMLPSVQPTEAPVVTPCGIPHITHHHHHHHHHVDTGVVLTKSDPDYLNAIEGKQLEYNQLQSFPTGTASIIVPNTETIDASPKIPERKTGVVTESSCTIGAGPEDRQHNSLLDDHHELKINVDVIGGDGVNDGNATGDGNATNDGNVDNIGNDIRMEMPPVNNNNTALCADELYHRQSINSVETTATIADGDSEMKE